MFKREYFLLLSISAILIIPPVFAQEETEITVTLEGDSVIDLDSSQRLIRAYVDVANFNPQDGYYYMKIIQPGTGKIIVNNEVHPKEKGGSADGTFGVPIAYMINDEKISDGENAIIGNYTIWVDTEFGTAVGTTSFMIIKPSQQPIGKELEVELSESMGIQSIQGVPAENELEIGQTSQTSEELTIEDSDAKIPEWVKNIFVWYAEDVIAEGDLLEAIKYLIEQDIIKIEN